MNGWYFKIEFKDGTTKKYGPHDTQDAAQRSMNGYAMRENTKSFVGPYYEYEQSGQPNSETGDPNWVDVGDGIQVHIHGDNRDLLTLYRYEKSLHHERVLRGTSFNKADFSWAKNTDGTYIIAWKAGRNRDVMGAWVLDGNKYWFSGMQMHTTHKQVNIKIVGDNVIQFIGNNGSAAFLKFEGPEHGWKWSGAHE